MVVLNTAGAVTVWLVVFVVFVVFTVVFETVAFVGVGVVVVLLTI